MQQRKHSIADEYDLGNLRAMFAARASSSTAAAVQADAVTLEEGPTARAAGGMANASAKDDELVPGALTIAHELLYSLSDEYAATVLQQRWRERIRKKLLAQSQKA